jgi:dTDP-4-amino-4,6-dideoxygalactose transaminase
MNTSLDELEQALALKLGRRHCVLAGRGASAIYLALKALPARSGKVIVPDITCPSPATAPLYAGFEPLFCDISLLDFNMDPGALRRLLETHDNIAAVMPVHLYGQAAPIQEILQIATEYGVSVIEDAAQALGGSYRGRMLGSWGDISVVSFGHTKTLDVGWGGAALTDDDVLAERMRKERLRLPGRPPHINQLFDEYRKVYYSIIPLTELNPELHSLFVPLPEIYEDMYLFRLEESQTQEIRDALETLEELVQARRKHARAYRKALQHPALHHPILDENDAPWRYSFLVGNGLQKRVTQELRTAGIDVSSWYPNLHQWYRSGRGQDPSQFLNATRVAQEVVNLWVTPNLPAGRIEQTCEIIHRILADSLP